MLLLIKMNKPALLAGEEFRVLTKRSTLKRLYFSVDERFSCPSLPSNLLFRSTYAIISVT